MPRLSSSCATSITRLFRGKKSTALAAESWAGFGTTRPMAMPLRPPVTSDNETAMSYRFATSETPLGWFGEDAISGWGAPFGIAPVDAGQGSTPLDQRSETNIATLKSWVQPVARQFIEALRSRGIDARVISGTRSHDEQNALHAQGRTGPGRIVTNARGGYSNHNFGIAFDIGVFKKNKYLNQSPLYAQAGPIGKSFGLSWGGDWKSFRDEPHYELRPPWAAKLSERAMLAELRQRVAAGVPIT
jgi:peptidoglycan L-alanyl-D-glutamate endopeptidase CwlK